MLCSALLMALCADTTLPSLSENTALVIESRVESPARLCPKYGWEYSYSAFGSAQTANARSLRFRVYAQSHKSAALAANSCRFLMRLWDLSKTRLGIDHPLLYSSIVDVFLADGGKAGGEQGIFHGPDGKGGRSSYNCIYIYHVDDFADPVEMVRELSHEYGHAVLPPVGGFATPEDWGNGFLGEKLFTTWVARALSANALKPEDCFGAKGGEVGAWVKANAEPLADMVWRRGPDASRLASKGDAAMNEYIGTLLFLDEAMPQLLGRALKLSGGRSAKDALSGIDAAVAEQQRLDVVIPTRLSGNVWLPLPQKWTCDGAAIVKRKAGWAEVKPRGRKVTLRKGSATM